MQQIIQQKTDHYIHMKAHERGCTPKLNSALGLAMIGVSPYKQHRHNRDSALLPLLRSYEHTQADSQRHEHMVVPCGGVLLLAALHQTPQSPKKR